ncbi:ABC transporter ATP-binding protein [Krasilnikoviella flava]|uniref:Putative ABC transport system ATP-binding protein n=1 Tax=Krasilnikoviella flava TaxID=526729 RepID=A0A1T5KZ95_9MICO|nr:ABC transporter ATP-binding protein [Krasilnikoviella flava]SKC69031.1 putative ABC transport system ATP-binding protein [Krasilnikoviella flava]
MPAAPTTVDARPTLRVRDLRCEYPSESGPVHALRGIDLDVAGASFIAIMGPSGSGKTTLLHCAAGLQVPTSGEVRLGGQDLAGLDQTQLARLRRQRVGFVFQSFNLLPALSTVDNVELPLRLDARRPPAGRTAALLARVGLDRRSGHRPDQLSGGQRQRVAIARALVTEPEIVFADEPTGALDIHSAREVLTLLRELADNGQTIIMVTHDPVAASFSDHVLFLADGRIVDELAHPTAQGVAGRMATLVESAERASNRSAVL